MTRWPPTSAATPQEELLDLAGPVPAGSGGLLMLPYLLSERAPHWSALPQGAYVGLSRAHRREHLIRAALGGRLPAAGRWSWRRCGRPGWTSTRSAPPAGSRAARCGGRCWPTPSAWPIHFPQGHEGSSFGAALLGMQALGIIDSIDVAADLVQVESTVRPGPAGCGDVRVVAAHLRRAVPRPRADLHHLAPAGPRPALRRARSAQIGRDGRSASPRPQRGHGLRGAAWRRSRARQAKHGSHGVAAHRDHPHPIRESSAVGEQRAVQPGLDRPASSLGWLKFTACAAWSTTATARSCGASRATSRTRDGDGMSGSRPPGRPASGRGCAAAAPATGSVSARGRGAGR